MSGAATVGRLVVTVTGDVDQLKIDMREAQAITGAATKDIVNGLQGITDATSTRNEAGKRMIAAMQEEIKTFGMSAEELKVYKAGLLGVGDQAAAMVTRLNEMKAAQASFAQESAAATAALRAHGAAASEAGGHVDGFSFATAAAKRELIVLAHELSQGNYKKFGGSIMVLAEQTGAAGMLFSATGLAALGMAAGVAFLAAEAYHAATEIDNFSKSMIVTNGASGLTLDSMHAMAAGMESASTGGIRAAIKTLEELSATGRYSGASIEATGVVVLKLASLTGQSSEEIIKSFDGMSGGVAKWAAEATKQYNFINGVQYEHIRQLELHGQKDLAVIETMNLLDASLDTQSRKIGYWTANAMGWADMLGTLDRNIKKMLSGATLGEKVDAEMAKLVSLKKQLANSDPDALMGDGAGMLTEKIAAQRKVVTAAIAAANGEELGAAKKQADAKANLQSVEDRVEIDALMKKIATKAEKRALAEEKINGMADRENARAKEQGQAEVVTASDRQKMIDDADQKYADKAIKGNDDRAKILADALLIERTSLGSEKSIYDERDKMLTLYHKDFGTSDDKFYAGRAAARQDYINAEAASFAIQKALITSSPTKNPEEVAASKEKYDTLLKLHTEFTAKMNAQAGEDSVGAAAATEKQYQDIIKAIQATGIAEDKRLDDAITKQREHNATIGQSKEQVELSKQATEDLGTAQMQSDADFIRSAIAKQDFDAQALAAYTIRLTFLDGEIDRRKTLADLMARGAALEAAAKAKTDAVKLTDQAIKDWQNAGTSIAESLTSAFGKGGKAAGDMFKAYADGQAGQLRAQKDLVAAKAMADTDPAKIKEIDRANAESANAQIKSYADIASSAQGLFNQGSKGYAALGAASEVLHVAQVAMNLASIAPAMAAGAAQLFAQSGWGGFAGVAAMVAVVAGFGVAVSGGGGGGGKSAADVQKAQGTGTVFGDDQAKSDSIKRSIDLMSANSSDLIPINQSMLTALQSIDASMSGLTNLIVRTPGISDGSNMGIAQGNLPVSGAIGSIESELKNTTWLGQIAGGLVEALFGKVTQSIVDSGIQLGGSVRGLEAGQGINQYASVDTTKSSFFGLSKSTSNSVQTAGVGTELSSQFGLIFTNLETALKGAATGLGIDAATVTKTLDTLSIPITNVSLKGLTGDALTSAINAVVSSAMDTMTAAAFPEFDKFRKVGEGYTETVMRLVSDYSTLDASLTGIGMSFGAVGIDSITARENLITLSGGIDALSKNAGTFATNFLTKAEQLAPVQKYVTDQLASMGLAGVTTRDQFKEVVLGLNLTTDAGQAQFAAMMNLETAFAAVTPAIQDLTKSAQDIADERKGLQDQLDQLTMTSTQLLGKQRDALDASNQALFDQVQAAQAAKDAITEASTVLDLQGQIYAATGDKAGAASVLELQHIAALVGLTPAVASATKELWAAQAAATAQAAAVTESNTILNLQAELYTATGDKAGAAAVLEQQHMAALVGLTPAVAAQTQATWDAQAAATAQAAAATEANSILELQGQAYTAMGDAYDASAVQQKQNAIALALMTPELAKATAATWAAQAVQKVVADAVTQSNSLLSIQAQIYALTGNAAGAASVLEQQHAAALLALDPALRGATEQLWAAQAAADQSKVWSDMATALADSATKATAAAAAFRSLNDTLLTGASSALSPEDKYNEAKRQFQTATPDNLQTAETAFLDASKAWFGGSAGYSADFASVLAANTAAAQGQEAIVAGQASFWKAVQSMNLGGAVDGSHAGGLDFVPFDNYRANLHKGERVQTAASVKNGDAAAEKTNALLAQVILHLQAVVAQGGSVGTGVIAGIAKLADKADAAKRELARAS